MFIGSRPSSDSLDHRLASFETPASRPPQDEDYLNCLLEASLMLRSARRARLEARTMLMQPSSTPHILDHVDQFAHGADRFVEGSLLVPVEGDLDDALDAAGADHDGDADEEILDPILPVEPRRPGHHAFLVAQIGLGHLDRRTGRRIEGRAGFQQPDDLAAAIPRALDDFVEPLLCRPSHLDEVRQWDAGDGRIAHQRHHRVAMAAEHEGRDVLDRNLELPGEEIAKAGAVEDAGHADDALRRQPASLAHDAHHDVERIGDRNNESLRAVLSDRRTDSSDDPGIDPDEIVAAHPRLARNAGCDDDDVGAFDVGVIVGAADDRIVAFDRRPLHDIERLALRHTLDDIDEEDVAQLFESSQ